MTTKLGAVDALLLSLLRDYEQSGRALYHQMLRNLPRWRRWTYSLHAHHDRLDRLAHLGLATSHTIDGPRAGRVRWYRRISNPTPTK